MGRFDIDRLLNDLGIPKEEDAVEVAPRLKGDGDGAPTQPTDTETVPDDESKEMTEEANSHDSTAIDSNVHDHPSDDINTRDIVNSVETASETAEQLAGEINENATGEAVQTKTKTSTKKITNTNNQPAAFVRHDPTDTAPRPPDATGTGLGTEVDLEEIVVSDDPNRLRPTDGLTPLWTPTETSKPQALGDVLLQRGIVSAEQLERANAVLKRTPGASLSKVLVEMGLPQEAILEVVAELADLPFERIDPGEGYHIKMMETLGVEFCRVNGVLPLRREGRRIILGMTTPDDVFLLDEIRRQLGGHPIQLVLVTASDIDQVIELQNDDDLDDPSLDDLLADIAEDDVEVVEQDKEEDDFEKEASESPVIRYVNYIIQSALKEGASDIHIEPGESKLIIRFRIDGILFERMNPIARMHAAIISRLKIMANLDISERRIPQDGRIRAVVGNRKLDLRVSTMPTVAGEKCVMRILDSRSISVGLNQLGLSEDTLTIWQNQIKQPHGIILVTGPTGSGKTTTLYSSLREMDTARLNISTVEDPVEYHLAKVTQTQVHEKIGFTFGTALRALLRQDPDVLMVGEIRDTETAKIAVQAALTGHLVLSTLHTNDAPSSVTRLINIGVEPFLIGSALNSVLAQRLVRRICENCKVPYDLNEEKAEFLAMIGNSQAEVSIGEGCAKCRQTGYSGRLGIYEMLVINDAIRDFIAHNPDVTEFRRNCIERGMVSLRQDGMMKVANGMTTIEEVLRVTQSTI